MSIRRKLRKRWDQSAEGLGTWMHRHTRTRTIVLISTIALAVLMLIASNRFIHRMAAEERNRVQLWARATQAMGSTDPGDALSVLVQVVEGNHTIPIIVTNAQGEIITYRNIDLPKDDPEKYLQDKLEAFRRDKTHEPILLDKLEGSCFVYYSDSSVQYYLLLLPYMQTIIFVILIVVTLVYLMGMRRSEQNNLWAGLSRETAHQLGTPISSLMAWRDLLELSGTDETIVAEISKDIGRLETIANRFQKVGSVPYLIPADLVEVIDKTIAYMQPRISSRVTISIVRDIDGAIIINLSEELLSWVFENLIKNAVDAMKGEGSIVFHYHLSERAVLIDVQDTGCGIPAGKQEMVFRPGYSTRQRGWGLGLSLARRIVQDYHHGNIYVHRSEVGRGTTFRVSLPLPPRLDS